MSSVSKEALRARQKESFVMYKGGTSIADIAEKFKVSERMIYRDIDAFELRQLREWRTRMEEALKVADTKAPLSSFLKILNAKK